MSCSSCKNQKKTEQEINITKKTNGFFGLLINLILYFTALAITSIAIIPIVAIVLFRVIVIGKSQFNILPLINRVFPNKVKNNDNNGNNESNDSEKKTIVFENVEI